MNILTPIDLFKHFKDNVVAFWPLENGPDRIRDAFIELLEQLDGNTAGDPVYSPQHGDKIILRRLAREKLLICVGELHSFKAFAPAFVNAVEDLLREHKLLRED